MHRHCFGSQTRPLRVIADHLLQLTALSSGAEEDGPGCGLRRYIRGGGSLHPFPGLRGGWFNPNDFDLAEIVPHSMRFPNLITKLREPRS